MWGPERPQKCTTADDCAQIAENGLKPPFASPHLDFPENRVQAWEADFHAPPVLGGAALFDSSAPAVDKIQGP